MSSPGSELPGAQPGAGRLLRPVLVRMLEGRVGSTLLMRLLGTAREVTFDRVYPYEHSYLTYLVRLTGQLAGTPPERDGMLDLLYGSGPGVGPLPFPPPEGLDTAELAAHALRGAWRGFSGSSHHDPHARYYAEKYWGDPASVTAAGLEPVLIDLVRDPRDVIASIRAFNAKTGRQRFGRAESADDGEHLRRLVLGMRLRFAEFAAPAPDAVERIELRYEELVGDLPAQAERLSTLLGVELDAALARSKAPEMAGHATSPTPEGSIGRWRQDLAPEEVATIERRLGGHMDRLGYARSEAGGTVPAGPAA